MVPAESRGVLLEAWQQHQQLSIERDIQVLQHRTIPAVLYTSACILVCFVLITPKWKVLRS